MIFLILGTIFILWMIQNFYWKRKNLPPGPTPYPILGNFPFLNKYGFENAFDLIKKQYGDIHTIWLGETPLVMICDVPTIMETFIKDSETYVGRPLDQKVTELRTKGRYGLIFNDGELWKHHRRATLQI
uniref:Cytochrome P450 n=1 Tax=Panagrolaimus sp. JU765 TaxID=591449 RepID=A0AC34R462_9BILA